MNLFFKRQECQVCRRRNYCTLYPFYSDTNGLYNQFSKDKWLLSSKTHIQHSCFLQVTAVMSEPPTSKVNTSHQRFPQMQSNSASCHKQNYRFVTKNEAQWWPSLPVCEQAGSSHILIDFTQPYSPSLKNILPAIGPKCQGIRSSVFSFPSCKCDALFQCICQAFTLYFHRR